MSVAFISVDAVLFLPNQTQLTSSQGTGLGAISSSAEKDLAGAILHSIDPVQGCLDLGGASYAPCRLLVDGNRPRRVGAHRRLAKQHHQVTRDGRFAVMMDTQIELGRVEVPQRSLGRLKIKGHGAEVRLNIWSNAEGSLLTGRRSRVTQERTRLVVTATLRDRETGRTLWWGEATGPLGSARPLEVGEALVPCLAEAFGCSLSHCEIHLPNR